MVVTHPLGSSAKANRVGFALEMIKLRNILSKNQIFSIFRCRGSISDAFFIFVKICETLFRANMSELCSSDEITILKDESSVDLNSLPHGYFDCISLDANHLYDAVLEDLRIAIPLLKETGILCGDDLEIPFNEIPESFDFKSAREWEYLSSGRGFHPGVTLAVWETFGKVKIWNGLFVVGKQGQDLVNVVFPSKFQMFFARKPYSSNLQYLQLIFYRVRVFIRPRVRIKKMTNSLKDFLRFKL